jgi:hypothetical protein
MQPVYRVMLRPDERRSPVAWCGTPRRACQPTRTVANRHSLDLIERVSSGMLRLCAHRSGSTVQVLSEPFRLDQPISIL